MVRGRLVEGEGGPARLEDVEEVFPRNNRDGSGLRFGGRLAFRSEDGTPFLSMGERRNIGTAQDPRDHRGSIIRIRDDGAVPDGNPFAGEADEDDHIWSYGHRNIQAMAFHPDGGEIWVADHGPRGGDRINRIKAGRNYGWLFLTGGVDYSGAPIGVGAEPEGMGSPLHVFEETVAPSGLAFQRSDALPDWRGRMLWAASPSVAWCAWRWPAVPSSSGR
ncbi:hypothetical protein GCM10010964_30880 [Caldovatus sediminis]|uniref:Glucose/Sorbosone dehydrogenase domain-containing protein n=1 Tax=Caldovatus sediminis TaxID=2041189 RepID=A0A8J2ZDM6_9PROT|nr:hypothetical protein GCM10010964_30880 [Caldovatus sediminis]